MAFWNRATNLRARYSAVHGKIEPEEWMGRILSAAPRTPGRTSPHPVRVSHF